MEPSLLHTFACADGGPAFDLWRSAIGRDGYRELVEAAYAQGFSAEIEAFPATLPPRRDDNLAARIVLLPVPARGTALFRAIPTRRTYRGTYDGSRGLPATILQDLSAPGSSLGGTLCTP